MTAVETRMEAILDYIDQQREADKERRKEELDKAKLAADRHEENSGRLVDLKADVSEVKEEVKKTNGRVTRGETRLEALELWKKRFDRWSNTASGAWKMLVLIAGIVAWLLGHFQVIERVVNLFTK